MRKIKFSHEYMKMPDDFEESTLLEVFTADRNDLCPEFVEFDTAIIDAGNYPLPRGKLLVLILQTRSFQLWTTIRRWTPEKEKYYRGLRGEFVECIAPLECQCAVLDERWLCQACGHCWYGSLTREGCPNCGADIDHIDMRNDLVGDIQGKQA